MIDLLRWDGISHFKPIEFACPCCGLESMDKDFLVCLDYARDSLGEPIRITSGWRCRSHNAAVGGVDSSLHTRGLAADVFCVDSRYRYRLMFALMEGGQINRFGIYISHMHFAINPKPERAYSIFVG